MESVAASSAWQLTGIRVANSLYSIIDINGADATARRIHGFRSAIVTIGPQLAVPWWRDEVLLDPDLCALSVCQVSFRGKVSKQVTAWELPLFLLKMLPVFLSLRRRYDYMFTFECSLTTFGLAFWQTLLCSRRPRHVVLQFIMREKTRRLSSRLKYAAMKWCFRSLHLAICSATQEAEYYNQVFGWPMSKTAFVPYHTTARHLTDFSTRDDGFVMAAGRVFRDYSTFYNAMCGSRHRAIVVASPLAPRPPLEATNIEFHSNIPLSQFEDMMQRASVVVVPLENRQLSAGQLVFLLAMALGKPVIATRTTGTIDYLVDGFDGLLVEPNDPDALRAAIDRLMSDSVLRKEIGDRARKKVERHHLPHHYSRLIRDALRSVATATSRSP